jgi:hypothetical protein
VYRATHWKRASAGARLHLDPNGQVLNTEKGGSVKSNPPVFGGAPLFCKGINLKIQEILKNSDNLQELRLL